MYLVLLTKIIRIIALNESHFTSKEKNIYFTMCIVYLVKLITLAFLKMFNTQMMQHRTRNEYPKWAEGYYVLLIF